jgi:glycosyltransferase involved in cell wall biosynthesis
VSRVPIRTSEDHHGITLVVDAVGVRPGSAAIVIGNLLAGWTVAAPDDRITVLVDGRPEFPLPPSISVRPIVERAASLPARLRAQSVGVRSAARELGADGLLSAVTASSFLGAPCPRGTIVYDLRHELRPAQFSPSRRLARKLLYGWSFRRSDALICISERTRGDLLARRPRLRGRAHTALLGVDHARSWRAAAPDGPPYVLAFGHFANKNVDRVLHAWHLDAARRGDGAILRICGLSANARAATERLVRELDIGATVELLPWLDDDTFQSVFAGAAGVLFPSDFEGFGLPALEALLLGVPVVISTDPALLEITGGHAVVAADDSAQSLAAALNRALHLTPAQIAAGVEHARTFTWERCARQVREIILSAG